MRLFKPMFKNKKGKWQETKGFWIEVVDKREQAFRKVLQFSAESESEKLAETLGNNAQKLIDYATLGEPNPDMVTWFQNHAPKKLQDKLIAVGLLPAPVKEEKAKPLLDYLPEFQKAVFDASKNSKLKKTTTADISAKTVTARIRKLIEGCGFATWADVSAEKVNDYIEKRPDGMSQQTAHFYAQAFKRFGQWLFDNKYIDRPVKIRSVPPDHNYGRCFELEEFQALLEAARTGPERFGLSGYQRYVLYLLACETGLRRGELRSLTVGSVDLKNCCISVKGGEDGATKNKDDACQYVTRETAEVLREYVKGKMPTVPLFPKIDHRSGRMVQEDCEAADVKAVNHKGKLGLHSLRHTCGSYLLAQGVHPKEVQEIMRHKDYGLTMNRYGHSLDGYKREAVNKLPRFAVGNVKKKTA